jgi:archaemetzincin
LKTLPEHTIIISPVGDFENSLFEIVCRKVNGIFGFPTEVISLLSDVSFAYDHNRDQYNSTLILKMLSKNTLTKSLKILAVTKVDIFIPILTYVYGEAQLGGRAAIISTHRLEEALSPVKPEESFHSRVCKEAVHELGHAFNLRHCQDSSCIMHYCRSIQDVDKKSDQLCRYCRILLSDEIKKIKPI